MSRDFDAVIFDMDGTLVETNLDFQAIRSTLGVPPDLGVLEGIEQMAPDRRRRAHDKLLAIELDAARDAALIPGAARTVQAVGRAGLKRALLTRNAAEVMEIVLARFPELEFDLAWSREQGPIKPAPDGVLQACREMGISPKRTACVGDFHYDVIAANSAGAVSVLYTGGRSLPWADEADCAIDRLEDLLTVLGLEE